jgi:hypothetical protein
VLSDRLVATFLEKRGTPYRFASTVDGPALARLLKLPVSDDEIDRRWRIGLDGKFSQETHTLAQLGRGGGQHGQIGGSLSGCAAGTAAAGVASAVQSTLTVIRDVRSLVCTAKLDPLFGDPRAGEETYAPVRHDAGALDGAVDAGEAGAP